MADTMREKYEQFKAVHWGTVYGRGNSSGRYSFPSFAEWLQAQQRIEYHPKPGQFLYFDHKETIDDIIKLRAQGAFDIKGEIMNSNTEKPKPCWHKEPINTRFPNAGSHICGKAEHTDEHTCLSCGTNF